MSSKNNVNPDHYKVAGRDRPNEHLEPEHTGRDIEAENKRPAKGRRSRNFIPGAAPVGESPETDEEEAKD
jgi:hypothetical protein